MKILFLTLLFPLTTLGWTLNNNFGASFKKNKVKVYVDAGTVCPNNSITVNDLQALVEPAVDDFWNKVPTSALKLEAAGFSPTTQSINSGRLCSPTDEPCITDGTNNNNLIPAVEDIIIACNDNALNFNGNNVLAVTIPNKFSGKKIVGAIILINDTVAPGAFGRLSKNDKIAVISHEIGHAIGLGHSEDTAALMYYRTVNLRKRLGQDDIDGVSFLYPMKGDLFGLMGGDKGGILGGCGTISFSGDKKNPPGGSAFQMMMSLGALVLIFEILRLLNRAKARSTL